MALKFDYCCKKCWHMWKVTKKTSTCPKCGSVNIDLQYEKTDD